MMEWMTARERLNARLRWLVDPIDLGPDLFVSGIIIGRALYEGAVDLKDALRVAGEAQHAR